MTPAEELLAAVKEHATADVSFHFDHKRRMLYVEGVGNVCFDGGHWWEYLHEHDSASSAVYSAFLRARAKHPPAADSAEES